MCSTDALISVDDSFTEEGYSSQKNEFQNPSINPENAFQKDKQKNKEKITNFQASLLDLMKNPPLTQKPEDNDPDKYFLLSFLPEFKKMNENQKLDFKIEFSQLVKRILNPSSQPISVEHRNFNNQNDYIMSNSTNTQNPYYYQQFQTGLPQTAQTYNSSFLPTYQSSSNTSHQQFIPNNQVDIHIPQTSNSSFGENSC